MFNPLEYFVAQYRIRRKTRTWTAGAGQVHVVAEDLDDERFQPEWVAKYSIDQFLVDYPSRDHPASPAQVHAFLEDLPRTLRLEDQEWEIFAVGGSGKCARVYQASSREPATMAVKIVLEGERANFFDVQVETARHKVLEALGLPCTPVVFTGSDFLLKPWVKGEVGSELVDKNSLQKRHIDALLDFIDRCVASDVQIKDLKPRNMVFAAGEWVCVDPGQLSQGHKQSSLYHYYGRYLLSHWFKMKFLSMAYLRIWIRVALRQRRDR
ncbi:MAG: hypothetical protein AAF541_04120 [Pseudomonadota bacterium]